MIYPETDCRGRPGTHTYSQRCSLESCFLAHQRPFGSSKPHSKRATMMNVCTLFHSPWPLHTRRPQPKVMYSLSPGYGRLSGLPLMYYLSGLNRSGFAFIVVDSPNIPLDPDTFGGKTATPVCCQYQALAFVLLPR